ncbi:hypothetical protein F4604DRAFT_1932892 [Suillus subluteus]|nr:hypothetical protein F4604DRAFT_1932892 [Suillus subluteus]
MSSDGRTPLLMLPSHITRSRFMAFDAFPARKAAHWSICAEYMPMPTKLDNGEVITALRLFVMLTALQEEFIGQEIVRIREICGPRGRVIGVVSGGVDSTVTAKLMREAIGDRRTPHSFHNLLLLARQIMVDNGMLCLNEAHKDLGVNLTVADAT